MMDAGEGGVREGFDHAVTLPKVVIDTLRLPAQASGDGWDFQAHGAEDNGGSDAVGVGTDASDVLAHVMKRIGIGGDTDLTHDLDDVTGLEEGKARFGFGKGENTNGFIGRDMQDVGPGDN